MTTPRICAGKFVGAPRVGDVLVFDSDISFFVAILTNIDSGKVSIRVTHREPNFIRYDTYLEEDSFNLDMFVRSVNNDHRASMISGDPED